MSFGSCLHRGLLLVGVNLRCGLNPIARCKSTGLLLYIPSVTVSPILFLPSPPD